MSPTGAHHDVVPTIFGISLDGHDVNFYFIVNDILMCFFFGLAAQEITESFIPRSSWGPAVVGPATGLGGSWRAPGRALGGRARSHGGMGSCGASSRPATAAT